MGCRPILPSSLSSFIQRLRSQTWKRESQVLNLGVCVSGGPDSMALAYLLRELQTQHNMSLSGLIVDHKARHGSTDEALLVQENLANIGIHSAVLTMSWPDGVDPLRLSDFESQARTKRYCLLANAAQRHDIHHLLLGHHQDDQVETVLMRLIRNQNTSLKGLAGMAVSSSVPSAFDVFGVHTRGEPVSIADCSTGKKASGELSKLTKRKDDHTSLPKLTLPGGISLERPLLGFTKAELIATCQANDIPYVVDPTNKDPTTTLRNAVRHLREHHNLPKALSHSRILQLQQTAQTRINLVKKTGDALLSTCVISNFDLRAGVVTIEVPFTKCTTSLQIDAYAYAIGKLAEMVTPNVRVNRSSQVPPHILSRFCNLDGFPSTRSQDRRTSSDAFVFDKVQFVGHPSRSHTWTLSRQPMRLAEIEENTKKFLGVQGSSSEGDGHHWSNFLLWDNRFWIRVSTFNIEMLLEELEIRPLQEHDIQDIINKTKQLKQGSNLQHDTMLNIMQNAAPGKIRYTLPVLTFKGRLVALPTLDFKLHDALEELGISALEYDVYFNTCSLLGQYPNLQLKCQSDTKIQMAFREPTQEIQP